MNKSEMLKSRLNPTSKGALIAAKVIAVSGFCLGVLFLLSEVLAFCMYGIPLLVVEIAKVQGVGTGADWVIGGTLWFLPSLFLVLVLALAHWALLKACIGRMFRWMVGVLKKSA